MSTSDHGTREAELSRRSDLFRNELIRQTVLEAAGNSQFYGSLYSGVDFAAIQTVDDLSVLPTVSKERLRDAGRAALCRPEQVYLSHIQNTTGTTHRPFFLYRSLDESLFIQTFFKQLAATAPVTRSSPIALQFANPVHGTPTPIPGNVFVVQGSVQDDDGLDRTLRLLRMTFDAPGLESRVTLMSGAANDILILTDWLIENDVDARAEFDVRGIQPIGRYITNRWREVLETTWNCVVMDRYSLSEVFGGATACPGCLGYHFDPLVVPEIQSFNGQDSLKRGVGRMLLTALHPFVQLQPFIRYITGDLFEIDPDACASDVTFRFLGRESHALFELDDPTHLLLTGIDLINTLDASPELARDRYPIQLRQLRYTDALGLPRARGYVCRDGEVTKYTLRAELAVPLALFPGRLTRLRDELEAALLRSSPALAELVAAGRARLCVELTGPGALGHIGKITNFWSYEG